MGGFMLTLNIMAHLGYERKLQPRDFDLFLAMQSGKPVILWHTTNGQDYVGYELLTEDTFGSNIAMGVKECQRSDVAVKIHTLSDFYFVEHDGQIAPSTRIWPQTKVYWFGNDVLDRYRIEIILRKKKVPQCKG
jgi:hypothetical protein